MAGGVNDTHLLIFTQQFSSMIRSNLQLVDVLDNLAKETPQKRLRQIIEDIAESVKHGVDLGDALAGHPGVFNEIYVNVVRAGMASGRLGEAMIQITSYLSMIYEITRQARSAMTYPIFMLVAFFAVFNGMVFFILPRFAAMFANFGRDLPFATQVMIDIGNYWKDNWLLIIGGVVLTPLAFVTWIATEDGRAIWDRIKLRMPVIGSVWRLAALSRFIRTLAVQIKNEVMLLDALIHSAEASGNVYLRETIYDIAEEVERGSSIAAAFREYRIFEGIVLQMISSGEEAGELDELLLSAADYFERLLRNRLETVTGWFAVSLGRWRRFAATGHRDIAGARIAVLARPRPRPRAAGKTRCTSRTA